MAIKLFFHICAITRAETVVQNMIRTIHFSGLYDEVEKIYCYLSGSSLIILKIVDMLLHSGKKFVIVKTSPEDTSYERLTLEDMHRWIQPNDKVLYIHSKGVSLHHQDDPLRIKCIDDWCFVMLYYLVRHYKTCLEKLDTYDTVGVTLRGDHWSGNFWWVTGSYFLTLPTKIGPEYFDPEINFLFRNKPKAYEMHSTGNTNIYLERYEPSKYIDNDIKS